MLSSTTQFNNRNQYNVNESFFNPYKNTSSTGFNPEPSSSLTQSKIDMSCFHPSTNSYYSTPSFSYPTNYAQSSFYLPNPNSCANFSSNPSQMLPQQNREAYLQSLPSQSAAPSFLTSAYSSTINPLVPSSGPTNHPILKNPFKDPHGLTHIFPDEDPELLTELKFHPFVPSVSNPCAIKEKEIPLKGKQQYEFSIPDPGDTLSRFNRSEKFFFFNNEMAKKERKTKCKRDFKEIKETIKRPAQHKDSEIMFYINAVDHEIRERFAINAYLSSNLLEIKEKVLKLINSRKDFNLKYNHKVLTGLETIAELGILENSELVLQAVADEFPSASHLPVTQLLKVTPSIEEMKLMGLSELKNIQNLTLENDYGKIEYEGPTNVVEVNFDQFISFTNKQFISFPNGENSSDQRLNKPAFITLYNISPRKNPGKVEISLRVKCEETKAEFIKYNPDSQEFTFKIQHL